MTAAEPVPLREKIVRKIADAAGVEPADIGDTSTLDSLGLDSSDAAILALEIEFETGQEIDVATFLRAETIGEAVTEISRLIAG